VKVVLNRTWIERKLVYRENLSSPEDQVQEPVLKGTCLQRNIIRPLVVPLYTSFTVIRGKFSVVTEEVLLQY
jgi:hypothetical protein